MDVLEDANQHQQHKNLHDLNSKKIDEAEFIKRQENQALKHKELVEALQKDIDSEKTNT